MSKPKSINSQEQRIKWIDLTKGIAIFLMVCGHTSIPSWLSNWIWSFHMPLFFIISGMLFNPTKYNLKNFIKRRIHTLIIPYIAFSLIVLMINENSSINIWLYQGWMNGCALWFLPVLFLAETYSFFIIRTTATKNRIVVCAVIFGTIGYILYLYGIRLPYDIDVSFSATSFYLIGYILCKMLRSIELRSSILIIIVLSVNFILSIVFPRTDMASNTCGWYGLNAVNAIIGTIAIVLIAKQLLALGYFRFCEIFFLWGGRNTLVILGLSQTISMLIKPYMENIVSGACGSVIRHIILWILLYILEFM